MSVTAGWGSDSRLNPMRPQATSSCTVRMWDKENILQQQALGIIGVNLVYGAFYYINDQDRFIRSLADNHLTVD